MISIKDRLVDIVGQDNVSDSADTLTLYSSDKSFAKSLSPRLVVRVKDVTEVQRIVRLANETKTPLIPISSGFPHHRGDTVPSVPGAVIIDLSGMKQIISVNRVHRMAVIEPGVTYAELQAELARHGLTISTSLAPRSTKSVLASVLEIEPRLNSLHQWCMLDPLRCVQVTWGDGNTMYTGEAGGSVMDLEKQWAQEKWQIEPTGPMMLDFYRMLTGAQGSMGIVTWASVKCEILPQIHKMFVVPADKLEDLIDFSYRILHHRFSDEFFLVNAAYMASLLGKSSDQIQALKSKLPEYMAIVGVVGRDLLPEDRVAAQEADIAELVDQFGLQLTTEVAGISSQDILTAVQNPSELGYWKETYKGAFQDIFFTTTLDKTPGFIAEMLSETDKAGYSGSDVGIYLQPQNMGTSYHCEFNLPYDSEDLLENKRMKSLFEKASIALSAKGAYFMRPYGIWSRLQLNRDAQSTIVLKDLKAIFDPNGIMNPGKLSNY